jgi:hypothetical protein
VTSEKQCSSTGANRESREEFFRFPCALLFNLKNQSTNESPNHENDPSPPSLKLPPTLFELWRTSRRAGKTSSPPPSLARMGAPGRLVQAPDRQRSKNAEIGAFDIVFMVSKITHPTE